MSTTTPRQAVPLELTDVRGGLEAAEMFLFDGTNGAQIVAWANNPDRVYLDHNEQLRVRLTDLGLDAFAMAGRHVLHTRGTRSTGRPFFFFDLVVDPSEERGHRLLEPLPAGHTLPDRRAWQLPIHRSLAASAAI